MKRTRMDEKEGEGEEEEKWLPNNPPQPLDGDPSNMEEEERDGGGRMDQKPHKEPYWDDEREEDASQHASQRTRTRRYPSRREWERRKPVAVAKRLRNPVLAIEPAAETTGDTRPHLKRRRQETSSSSSSTRPS